MVPALREWEICRAKMLIHRLSSTTNVQPHKQKLHRQPEAAYRWSLPIVQAMSGRCFSVTFWQVG